MTLSPGLRPLWRAVHERLSSGRPVSTVRVGPLADAEREALADLLGLAKLPAEYATVSLSRLDAVLEPLGLDLHTVVADLLGPLDDRAARRAEAAAERTELWHWLETHDVVVSQPALGDWTAQVRRAGVVSRELLERALHVLSRLPAGGVPLPAFADEVLGDAHALDDGTRESSLVLRALATVYSTEPPASAAERRALWERAGIADDALSAVVLATGLAPGGDGIAAVILRACATSGNAAALTLGQLRATTFTDVPPDVWIVENPSVLAVALSRFGGACPPLVCTSGWPNSAGMLLLDVLAAAGASLHYHGDFDGEGLRIAAHVMARTGARPWHLTTSDYLTALATNPTGTPVGRVTDAPWDPALADALRTHKTAVAEERVTDRLLTSIEGR
ncbi:TIGR02679 family protein [Amycolatopsis sp. H20-H5]|uniref:TIGR02679 family protein n=1 Tax=Amycolatopsis sp. H20-H5 TaxID=3046309 RepID=UPI002DB64148|nr:TIGR02679 family protein [Amycolatopsis sp. H20-H5]MEC3977966.1 TIGR02679 family protein [Amycolatopsis sp. H20-H5]